MSKVLTYTISFLFFSLILSAQNSHIEVQGVVVEVTGGKKKPVPNIKVIVPGEAETVTDFDGSFTMYFPSDKEYISISLEGCPHPIVSPYAKRVNIPPNEFLEIKVCAHENKKLRSKINTLNDRIRNLERQRKLNKRQLAAMHKTLLDTVLFFESKIKNIEDELNKKENELVEKNDELIEKDERIVSLEKEVAELEEKLAVAIEEKYLRQKDVFDKISTALNQYIDQAKNLRDNMRPVQIKAYFSSAPARERLYESIEKYNAARREVLDNHENHIVGVSNYWEAFELADELESTYQYLLETVHKEGVYPMEFAVNDNLKKALTRQLSSGKAKKAAEAGATEAIPNLNPMIDALEEKASDTIQKLKNNL